MRNQVRRYQHFDTCEARQEVLIEVRRPSLRLPALLIGGARVFKRGLHKDARAAGGVKDRYIGVNVGQSVTTGEARTQQVINRARDIGNDRLRCVIDAMRGTQTRIVVVQKAFIEMGQGIVLETSVDALPVKRTR